MLYTVYRTVNLANGKYYFGVHKTRDPSDDYLGSGKYVKAAIAKYGERNFRKEVLFIYLDPESAFGKEDELIQCYRGLDPLCMNLRKGGSGGFDWINSHLKIDYRKRWEKALSSIKTKIKEDPQFKHYWQEKQARGAVKMHEVSLTPAAIAKSHMAIAAVWRGRKHTDDTKQKMSEAGKLRVGSKNSQCGTCWVTKEFKEKKIPGYNLNEYLKVGWHRGRKNFTRVVELADAPV